MEVEELPQRDALWLVRPSEPSVEAGLLAPLQRLRFALCHLANLANGVAVALAIGAHPPELPHLPLGATARRSFRLVETDECHEHLL